jgi:phospholipase D1/2
VVPLKRVATVTVAALAVIVAISAWPWAVGGDAGNIDIKASLAAAAPHRTAWYALPVVAVAYIALGLAFVPVLALVAATGVAFGPWLGPVYAMTGCVASASTGFGLGRWVGRERVQQFGGTRVRRLHKALERNGTLAVFVLRKVPAPFMLANIVVGASGVRYRDFLIGTILGMGALVIALAGFGYRLTRIIDHPSWTEVFAAVAILAVPLTTAVLINRALRRRADAR